jgi:hypothetical protein
MKLAEAPEIFIAIQSRIQRHWVRLKGVLDLHVCDANRQAGTKAGGGACCLSLKADAIQDRNALSIEEESVAVVGWEQAGRAGIAIEGAKGEGRSGGKSKRG